ncbi:hypothetical protein TSUD_405850 [Trifolium subterraneum]|uniref:Chromo domain-containing protein n=1 Tax=Trifolium subterraneum TaxID=3900 RepID=A0A2Z6NYS2_TRISU|nr:hypothetical protein TSUD_405850 [Trifolium subterraneum]
MVVTTRSIMENRIDLLENRIGSMEISMGNLNGTMEQVLQMVFEQQAQPQITIDQIRQLIEDQHGRRHQRPRRDDYAEDESEDSTILLRRPGRNEGRYRRGFAGSRRRLEIPIFKGEDAYGWLVRVERYFRLNGVRVQDKVDAVVLAMEEKALNWFQWWEEQTPLRNWEEFKVAVLKRFQPGLLNNPLGPLLSLRQKSSVMEYRDKFEQLVAPLRRDDRVMLDSIFLNGLKEEIQAELKLYESHDLTELMDRALLIEERNEVTLKRGAGWRDRGANHRFKDPGEGSRRENDKGGAGYNEKYKGKRLEPAELEERSKKGLCFKCGDKWNKEHICKFKHMSLRLCEGSSDEEVVEEIGRDEEKETVVMEELKTLSVLTLIDSGATSNFIASKLVEELGLPLRDTPTYVIETTFFSNGVRGSEMVLGMDWLESLGNIEANFGNLSLKWEAEGKKYSIQGDPTMSTRQSSWKSLKAMQTQWKEILEEFEEVFNMPAGMPPTREHDHSIVLKPGAIIPNIRPYRYPYYQKNEIEKIVKEMLQAGIIRHNTSPYSSPVLLVKKKDEGWRFCTDYRALNKVTIPNKFPIPVIDELLDELGGAVIFSKLDLKSGYHQIRMNAEDIPKTAFRTHEGHYEYLVMPFGLTNTPSTFQALMNEVLRPHLRKFVKKCSFGQKEVEYLGHLISGKGVSADPKKIEDMNKWPYPKELKGLRGFLGLTGYYRKFVKNYSKIAWPLTQLLKKDNFIWGDEAQHAFDKLKQAMVTIPVLAMPNFNKEFVIETDASGKGIGAVLMQEGRPVAYMSQTLSDRAQGKSVYERELMAIVIAIQKWRPYLLERHFKVHTDQKSLKFLTEQRIMGEDQQKWIAKLIGFDFEDQQKWIAKLIGFDFEVKYKPGKENNAADALSIKMTYATISTVQCEIWEGLEEEVQNDEKLKKIVQALLSDPLSQPGYQLKGGRLFHEGRVVIPRQSPRIDWLLNEFHSTAVGGHSGYLRTYKKLVGLVHWEGMRKKIKEYVEACEIWADISMDFIGGLPKVHGTNTIMVVVDRLTKYAHFLPVNHPYNAKDIATLFIKEIVRLHGFPSSIVSDQDKSDSQTEVVNRCVETYLRCLTGRQPKQWPKWLAWAEYWYNTNYHASLKSTPFEALYGRSPPVLIRGNMNLSAVEEVNKLTTERNVMLREMQEQLLRAQDVMRAQANKHRREVEYQVGDMIYLKIQPYKLRKLANRINQKLSPRYYGPYEVEQKIGEVAYKLKLPEESRVHPVFHASLLKKAVTPNVEPQPLPVCLNEKWRLEPEPEEALDTRRDDLGAVEVLVKWKDLPEFENSWESADKLRRISRLSS